LGRNRDGWQSINCKVAVENAEKRFIIETITANGKIQPEKEVKISPDVSVNSGIDNQRGGIC